MMTNIFSQDVSIILLAGGKSKRMGRDKCLIKLNGKTLLEHNISKAEKITRNILIIANQSKYGQFKYPLHKDIYTNKGPIGGIHTGLFHSTTNTNIVIGCDMPNLSLNFLQYMLKSHNVNFQATIPIHLEKIQPLAGVYEKTFLDIHESQIKAGKNKMKDLLRVSDIKYIDISNDLEFYSPYLFDNVNTVEDLQKYQQSNSWR